MIPRPKPERFRLRRTMMFMNAQKPGLIKDAYIYGCDSIMLDLEDAVAENQKDAARFSLYHAPSFLTEGKAAGHDLLVPFPLQLPAVFLFRDLLRAIFRVSQHVRHFLGSFDLLM